MFVWNAKARGALVVFAVLTSFFVVPGPMGSAKAQDQLPLEDFEVEKNLCVCGMDFYHAQLEEVTAEITAAREGGDDAASYYELIREWARLKVEADTLSRWCSVVPLELAPDLDTLTCPGD